MANKRKRKGKSWQLLVVTEDGYGHGFRLREIPDEPRHVWREGSAGKNLAGAFVVFPSTKSPNRYQKPVPTSHKPASLRGSPQKAKF